MLAKVSFVNFIIKQLFLEANQLSHVVDLEGPELKTLNMLLLSQLIFDFDKYLLISYSNFFVIQMKYILDNENHYHWRSQVESNWSECVNIAEEIEIEITKLRLEHGSDDSIRSSEASFDFDNMTLIDPICSLSSSSETLHTTVSRVTPILKIDLLRHLHVVSHHEKCLWTHLRGVVYLNLQHTRMKN